MDGSLPRIPPAAESPLAAALLDSRARWRDFALLSADLVFETDAAGRFTFLAPDIVLGHQADALIGAAANGLLAGPSLPAPGASPLGPFALRDRPRGSKVWLRCADGGTACLDLTVMSLPGEAGLRGAARDVTQEERLGALSARALRRATALGRLLRLGQRQQGPEAALSAMLASLPAALACTGAALLLADGGRWQLALPGTEPPPLHRLPPPSIAPGCDRLALVATPGGTALLAWREPEQQPLDADDRELLAALAMPMASLHAEMVRQQELARAAASDALTGLLNRRGFLQALGERLAQGAVQGGGVLAFIDLDGLKPLNDTLGHEAGDAALRGMAARLRAVAGARDLAARLGGDEFCLWLHGTTEAAAAGVAAQLGAPGPLPDWPQAGSAALRASIGLAAPRPAETTEALMVRADAAMYAVKRAKGERRR